MRVVAHTVRRWIWSRLSSYLFVAPAFLVIGCLIAYPFYLAISLSLSAALVGQPMRFIGLANYAQILQSQIFRQTLQNALIYTFAAVILKSVLGMGLALLLNQPIRGRKLFRGALLLPWVIPDALSTLGWIWMFDPIYSVLNWLLRALGLLPKGIPWLSDPAWAMASIVLVNLWRGLPFFAITFLAGLIAIPTDLYQAARVDGAGRVRIFWSITLPLLKPLLLIVLLFSTISTVSDFNIVYILTKGGPMNMTHVLPTLAFQVGLSGGNLGQGAAISLFLFPVLAVVVYFQLRAIQGATA
jgi:multiple sugar transport system permease protein